MVFKNLVVKKIINFYCSNSDNHNDMYNYPVCVFANRTVIQKIEISQENLSPIRRRVRREFNMKQTWNENEYYQVINDDFGVELTIRVNKDELKKNTIQPPTASRVTTSTPTTTTTTTTPTSTKKIIFFLTPECQEYKTIIERLLDWGFNEIYLLENSATDTDTCLRKLPAHKNTAR